jgi:glycosyltransferase involved in cell wall biosynthesis
MKVLLVADILRRDFDGCNRTLFQFLDRGIENSSVEYYCLAGFFEDFPKEIKHLKVPHVTIPFNKDYQIALPYFVSQKVNAIFNEFNPDIVHITTPSLLGSFMQKEAIKRGLPISTIYHTNFISYVDYYISTDYSITNSLYNFLLKKYVSFYNGCNLILCPTKSMKNQLKEIGVNENLLEIMARGINKEVFYFKKSKSDRFHKHFQNKYKNILFASRLVWEKNLRIIIDLYKYGITHNMHYNFIIAGDGIAYNTMKSEMPKALFMGGMDQNELCNVYNDADLFLFPSVTETFGNVVLEAMTCGLPVVAARGGSNPDVVDDGVNGILVEEKNLQKYFEAFEYILHEDHYSKFQKEALENKLSKSWEEINQEFVNQIEEIFISYHSNIAHP